MTKGTIVRVVQAVDRDIYDVSNFVGRLGLVKGQEDSPSDGEKFTRVRFTGQGAVEECFWPEEIQAVRA